MVDEIKLIVEALTQLGGDAKYAFYAYLVSKMMSSVLIFAVFMTLILVIRGLVRAAMAMQSRISTVREVIESKYGVYTGGKYSTWSSVMNHALSILVEGGKK